VRVLILKSAVGEDPQEARPASPQLGQLASLGAAGSLAPGCTMAGCLLFQSTSVALPSNSPLISWTLVLLLLLWFVAVVLSQCVVLLWFLSLWFLLLWFL
jgi:hypothetical protein